MAKDPKRVLAAKKAWDTMRNRQKAKAIKEKNAAAGKKAAETRRKNEQERLEAIRILEEMIAKSQGSTLQEE